MMGLTWRHLRRHWRLNLAVLLFLTLASAFLVGFSSYTEAVATEELRQNLLEVLPSERSILITGHRTAFSPALFELLQDKLGKSFRNRLVIRQATSLPDPQPALQEEDPRLEIALLEIYSFDRLAEVVRLVEGSLPAQVRLNEARDGWRPPPIEVVIGLEASQQSGYGIGDRLTGSGTYHRLDIVGIVQPLDPNDDIWGGDLISFSIGTEPADPITQATALPLIVASGSMKSNYPKQPIFPHQVSWRVTLNHQLISLDEAEALQSGLINFQVQSATVRAVAQTGLVQILADSQARLSRVRMAFFLLTAQNFILVLYTLTVFASLIVERSRVELATLSARGASAWQITRVFALENLFLTLPAALLLGPGLAQGVIRLWGRTSGELVPRLLPRQAWLLSLLAVGLCWLALVVSVYLRARRNTLAQQHFRTRPEEQSLIQRHYIDLYLLVFSGLLYWQLGQSGSFVMSRLGDSPLADPLLLIGPTLLLIAVATVSLRILPFLFRLIAWLAQRLRGYMLPLASVRLARSLLQSNRVVLLVSLTIGLSVFTQTFGDSYINKLEGVLHDPLAQGILGALRFNALTMVLFSVTALLLLYYFAAQGRVREFGLLRAMGSSIPRQLTMLVTEGIVVLLVGALAGLAFGVGLSHIMAPYLSQALAESFGGVSIERIVVDWPALARLCLFFILTYASALVLLLVILMRTRVRWALWMGDE